MIKTIALLILLAPLLISCPNTYVVAGLDCSGFVPERLVRPVAGAPAPKGQAEEEWVAFGTSQTSRLAQANDNVSTNQEIVKACEAQERDLAEQLRGRSAWERVTPWREGPRKTD